jgi:dolichol-phosphate mannosyltransferase
MLDLMKLSVIIPFYNEAGSIDSALAEVVEVLRGLPFEFEIIAINDGSTDESGEILAAWAKKIPELKIKVHAKNLGQEAGWWSGFHAASGDTIVTSDGDGQNDFHDVPQMLSLLSEYDAVFGQRIRREDPISKRIITRIAFLFRKAVLNDDIQDTGCGLKVFKKETLQHLIPVRGFLRFIPFLFKQAGVRFTTFAVHHRPRRSGKSKYLLRQLYFLPVIADFIWMVWYKKRHLPKPR